MARDTPELFKLAEIATQETMKRIDAAVASNNMALQVKNSPMLAYWFMHDALFLADVANRGGMHANALALTRQCIEAIGVVELGICGHTGAEAALKKWEEDRLEAGKLRAWLENNVWQGYGSGLWNEPWATFMREFAKATQPYAHYGRNLAQWQLRLGRVCDASDPGAKLMMTLEMEPRAYDSQKATRITLYHILLTYVLGRVWMAANRGDSEFDDLMGRLGSALGKSHYLDGHATDWGQQFWAILWASDGRASLSES